MDENQSEAPHRIVLLSPLAALDLSANHTYTFQRWDFDQAERYTEFLKLAMRRLAVKPTKGNEVANRVNTFESVVKWGNARHGHRIVYQIVPEGIYVLRILHTAMNWPEHI